jgi:hypothetical protein
MKLQYHRLIPRDSIVNSVSNSSYIWLLVHATLHFISVKSILSINLIDRFYVYIKYINV